MSRPDMLVAKKRLNLEIHPAVYNQLLALQERIGADSRSEAVRRAIQLYARLLCYQQVFVKDEGGEFKEVIIP